MVFKPKHDLPLLKFKFCPVCQAIAIWLFLEERLESGFGALIYLPAISGHMGTYMLHWT